MKKYISLLGLVGVILALGVYVHGMTSPFPLWLTSVTGVLTFQEDGSVSLDAGEVAESKLIVTTTTGLHALRVAHGTYNFSTQGGGTVATPINLGATLPANSTLVRSWYYIKTVPTAAATDAFDIRCEDAQNIVASTELGLTSRGFAEGVETGTAATMKHSIDSACNLSLGVATHALTAGNLEVWVQYMASANN